MWKPIPGFSRYEIHPDSRIRVTKTLKPMMASLSASGYMKIDLMDDAGLRKTCSIHRLVCVTHNGHPPYENAVVCHTDGDSHNNHATNLRWGSFADNTSDRLNHHQQKKAHSMSSPQKNKGSGYEREVAEYLSAVLGIDVKRTPLSGSVSMFLGYGAADLSGTPDLWCELKRVERFNPHAALAQAKRGSLAHGAVDMPVVITRRNRQALDESLCVIELKDFARLYSAYLALTGVRTTHIHPTGNMSTEQPL